MIGNMRRCFAEMPTYVNRTIRILGRNVPVASDHSEHDIWQLLQDCNGRRFDEFRDRVRHLNRPGRARISPTRIRNRATEIGFLSMSATKPATMLA